MKAKVIIFSSRESLDVARSVQEELDDSVVGAEASVWTQSIFELSKCSIESLVLALDRFDFGIFVFGADDVIRLRGFEYPSARDNVVFELGLFFGRLGRERSFLLVPKGNDDFHLPTDLLGVAFATFEPNRIDKDLRAAVGPACNKISKLIQMHGPINSETETTDKIQPSGPSFDSPLLNQLINDILQTACRTVALPQTPGAVKIRAFVFRKEDDQLVCSHYWASHPVREMVGKVRFNISAEDANSIAVVRCVLEEKITRAAVSPLPKGPGSMRNQISDEIRFVLAAPILNADGSVWGTVDFDASTADGQTLLSNEVSEAAIFQLAQLLRSILAFRSNVMELVQNQFYAVEYGQSRLRV